MPQTIEASEKQLGAVFGGQFMFRIPQYQRPYAWGTHEAGELLSDILEAKERDPLAPYFLGSVVLIKEPGASDSDVIDGQQRLTTLTILFCVMRELSDEHTKPHLDSLIRAQGMGLMGIQDSFRLSLRPRDRQFFTDNVQANGATRALIDQDTASFSDPQKLIAANVRHFWNNLKEIEHQPLRSLAEFIAQQCYLVVVSTTDRNSAYRIFSVMNDRGVDLSPTDILKSDAIGELAEADQEAYGQKWENIEERLGRDKFRDLFAHIRMMQLKTKLRNTLQGDFQDHVLKGTNSAHFIDNTLEPYSTVFETVTQASYVSTHGAEKVNEYLRYLNRLDNFDWIPPAMAYFHRHSNDTDKLTIFTKDLERLAYGLFVKRAGVNERILRYAEVLGSIEQNQDLSVADSPLQLTNGEKKNIVKRLDGEIYTQTAVFRRVLLERIDRLLDDNHNDFTKSHPTIEHVLPQNPSEDSEWANWSLADKDYWTHRLANLVLLSRNKNSSASNWNFKDKKEKYFQHDGATTFALTTPVINEPVWSTATLKRRQSALIGSLKKEWKLD